MTSTMGYDYFLVCSFEFTCDGKRSLEPQEIIEFCVFKYCLKAQAAVDRFYSFVKPQHPINAQLSTFCKMLTCISDRKLANAPSLDEVLIDFDRWIWRQGLHQSRFIFVPHTHFDLSHMLPAQCKAMGYHCPAYFYTWIHLEELHKQFEMKQVTKRPAVKQIRRRNSSTLLNSYGVKQEGRAHSAVDNCTNSVNLIKNMTEKGVDFTAKTWETYISRNKNSTSSSTSDDVTEDSELDPELDLKEEETMMLFGRANSDSRSSSRCGSRTGSRSGRCTPSFSGRTTPSFSGRTTPVTLPRGFGLSGRFTPLTTK